jgi:hypothetical protein
LGGFIERQGRPAEAEPIYREALAMKRKLLGNEHPEVPELLRDLGDVTKSKAILPRAKRCIVRHWRYEEKY